MNWSKLFFQGGYAFYVWGSYGLALLAMGGEVIFLLRRKKSLTGTTASNRKAVGK
jgi:heme exporter protein D